MTETLLVVAHRTLEASTSTPPLKAAAAEAMLVLLREGIALHRSAVQSLWKWLITMPSTLAWNAADVIGQVDDEEIRASALALFRTEESGHELRRFVGDVLRAEGHVQHLQDGVLLDLVDRARSADDVQIISRLVTAVHEARGVERKVLLRIREHWFESHRGPIREVAVEFEAVPLDADFVRRAFNDASVAVRVALANRIEWTAESDDAITAIVLEQLAVEEHLAVRAALLQVQAAFLGGGHRRRRPR